MSTHESSITTAELDEPLAEQMAAYANAVCEQLAAHLDLTPDASNGAELQAFLELGLAIIARHMNLMADE